MFELINSLRNSSTKLFKILLAFFCSFTKYSSQGSMSFNDRLDKILLTLLSGTFPTLVNVNAKLFTVFPY